MIRSGRERRRRDRNYLRDWEIWINNLYKRGVKMQKVKGVGYGKKQLLKKGRKP